MRSLELARTLVFAAAVGMGVPGGSNPDGQQYSAPPPNDPSRDNETTLVVNASPTPELPIFETVNRGYSVANNPDSWIPRLEESQEKVDKKAEDYITGALTPSDAQYPLGTNCFEIFKGDPDAQEQCAKDLKQMPQ